MNKPTIIRCALYVAAIIVSSQIFFLYREVRDLRDANKARIETGIKVTMPCEYINSHPNDDFLWTITAKGNAVLELDCSDKVKVGDK